MTEKKSPSPADRVRELEDDVRRHRQLYYNETPEISDEEFDALLRLGWRAKRAGDFDRAADLWREAGEAGEPEGWRELAMHHEHRTRDLEAALRAVEKGMRLASGQDDVRSWHVTEGFRHRKRRLERKRHTLNSTSRSRKRSD